MKINEAAKQLATSAWTLRYYEQIGVSAPIARVNGMREYSEADIVELRGILDLRSCGVTLDEIKQLQQLPATPQAATAQREILTRQADTLRTQVVQLQDSLERLEVKISKLTRQELVTDATA